MFLSSHIFVILSVGWGEKLSEKCGRCRLLLDWAESRTLLSVEGTIPDYKGRLHLSSYNIQRPFARHQRKLMIFGIKRPGPQSKTTCHLNPGMCVNEKGVLLTVTPEQQSKQGQCSKCEHLTAKPHRPRPSWFTSQSLCFLIHKERMPASQGLIANSGRT